MEFPNTGESGLLSVCPGIRTQKSGQCAGRRHGLEAGTDPQTIVAGGKGSFSWVTGIFCVNLFFYPPPFPSLSSSPFLPPFPFWIDELFPFAFSTQASDYK